MVIVLSRGALQLTEKVRSHFSHALPQFVLKRGCSEDSPLRLDFRRVGCGVTVDLDDSSDGREGLEDPVSALLHIFLNSTYPGCDMAGRLRAPRRGAGAPGAVDGAV